MRIVLAAAVVAAIFLGSRAALAGPWCAMTEIGGGVVQTNCSMRSLDMGRQEVIAGNRGFCSPNPRWQANLGRQKPARRTRPVY